MFASCNNAHGESGSQVVNKKRLQLRGEKNETLKSYHCSTFILFPIYDSLLNLSQKSIISTSVGEVAKNGDGCWGTISIPPRTFLNLRNSRHQIYEPPECEPIPWLKHSVETRCALYCHTCPNKSEPGEVSRTTTFSACTGTFNRLSSKSYMPMWRLGSLDKRKKLLQ